MKVRDGNKAPYYRPIFQMSRMVRAKGALTFDDRIDALAGAVAYWTAHLSRDTDKAVLDHKEAKLDAELKKFLSHAMGNKDPIWQTLLLLGHEEDREVI